MQLAHHSARFDAKLLVEQPVQPQVCLERVGLPARAVQRQHELTLVVNSVGI
jgi:hypothetical protein